MKVLSVVGARPQFIKAISVSNRIRSAHREILVHTGQHYDFEMSELFFEELKLPKPDINLDVGSSNHGEQTGRMIELLEKVILNEKPDCVIVYGDTNTTLAGALAASKLVVPVVHVEAGLRSFDRSMPEEINRTITDRLSDVLLCPTEVAAGNLVKEGIDRGVYVVGDVMIETLMKLVDTAEKMGGVGGSLGSDQGSYILATVHRAENTDSRRNLEEIVEAMLESGEKIVFPVHPRTRKALASFGLEERLRGAEKIDLIEPVGYFQFIMLLRGARILLTDSGGAQKESYLLGVPCVTMRDVTEWVETVKEGWNVLVGSDRSKIITALTDFTPQGDRRLLYGDGNSSERIVNILEDHFGGRV